MDATRGGKVSEATMNGRGEKRREEANCAPSISLVHLLKGEAPSPWSRGEKEKMIIFLGEGGRSAPSSFLSLQKRKEM